MAHLLWLFPLGGQIQEKTYGFRKLENFKNNGEME